MRFPYHGAGIALVADGCILLGKRSDSPFRGRWSVPGGGAEKTDSDMLCTAKRELLEETALVLDNLDAALLCRWSLRLPFFRWTTFFYGTGSSANLDIVLKKDEFSEYEWVSLSSVGKKRHLRPFCRSEVRFLIRNLQER